MKLLHVGLLLSIGLLLAAEEKRDPVKAEQALVQGTWNVVGLELDGLDVIGAVKDMTLTVKGDEVTLGGDFTDRDRYGKFTYTFDPAATPKRFDATLAAGDEKGTKFKGIYQLERDKLKVCLRLFGKDRPTDFATQANSGLVLITLQRAKKP